ncbi:MAG: 16S rRNA (guanine(966)-N(2))-methyltransferase RsmD [Clostridium sp.]|jgi:16S rRNA (guanine(966)-N(2))-methyltransferase RsmD|nr:16S rRNA (guanine(966)-N(2))-methyltransferase RsmD [Clostridium sp.]
MRVITGSARGKRLLSPAGEGTRPTTDRVKEALFSVIQFRLEGRRVLDLFAGSGQLGIEALSRGAAEAVFADNDRRALRLARQNAEGCGFAESCRFVQCESIGFLRGCGEKFSLVFLDPPYKKAGDTGLSLLEQALELLPPLLSDDAIVCAESPSEQALPTVLGRLNAKSYRHGKTKLTIYS